MQHIETDQRIFSHDIPAEEQIGDPFAEPEGDRADHICPHPARPSEYDRDHAWPWFSYIIVSVKGGKADEANAWQLKEDRSGFEALKLEKGE